MKSQSKAKSHITCSVVQNIIEYDTLRNYSLKWNILNQFNLMVIDWEHYIARAATTWIATYFGYQQTNANSYCFITICSKLLYKFIECRTYLLHWGIFYYLHLANRYVVMLVLLDLTAAFDTIDHKILLKRLKTMWYQWNSAQVVSIIFEREHKL